MGLRPVVVLTAIEEMAVIIVKVVEVTVVAAALEEPRQPDGCKLKTAPVRPVVAARPAEYVCSEDLFY